MVYAPVLLFVYNRLSHTMQAVSSLLQNDLASKTPLIIYSDAAKREEDISEVQQIRSYIHTIRGFGSITIIERDSNWGLARSIIDGVTTYVASYGKVIVVEDDLFLAPYFLQFMNDALEIYKDESKVGHIQACDFTQDLSLPDTFLIKWTGSWGWATWKRAWEHFNPDGQSLLSELENRKLTYKFDFNGAYPYTRMLEKQVEGKNDSWAIRWNASLFVKDILSLNVGKSLVQNMGFDGSGTNCGGGGLYDSLLWMEPMPVAKINPVKENDVARRIYQRYYKRTNSFWAKALRRVKRTLRGDFGA